MSEIELRGAATLAEQMHFARLVSDGSILPDAYRRNPANVLIAVGLGQSMGLSPAESLYRISVIKGKPTAAAELIAANVRRAGHKLRVATDERAMSVKATIIRADDPDFPHEVVRDMAWAQAMGLDKNDNYRKQPLTMLQWRAITAVARLAAPEALYGVQYTPDEMYDSGGAPPTVTAEQVTPEPSPAPDTARSAEPPTPSPVALPVDEDAATGQAGAGESPLLNTSSALAKRMFALMGVAGITDREGRLAYVSDVVGRQVESSSQMTDADAEAVIAALRADGVEG